MTGAAIKPRCGLHAQHRAALVHVLHPGDTACANEGERLHTLLGSCVSICLSGPGRHVGGMCHIMYSGPAPLAHKGSTAYAEPAMRKLFAELRAKGVDPLRCEAFVYGGGCMPVDAAHAPLHARAGERNVAWALAFLAEQGIAVRSLSVGGAHYRKVEWLVGAEAPCVDVVAIQKGT